MDKIKGHSLWLMPDGETAAELARLIECLASIYSTAVFRPHVTLIGQVMGTRSEVSAKTAELAASIAPYEISLGKVDYLNKYYQCLFVRAKKSNAVIDANKKAREIFERKEDSEYMPHLSLMYGDFKSEIKEEVIKQTGKHIKRIFVADRIHIFSTNGDTHQWKSAGEFKLTGI